MNHKHIPYKHTHNLIGSNTYASINAHNCIELSRRDDLESLGYMLIYFYLGSLPWQQQQETLNTNERIMYFKHFITESNQLPEVLHEYMCYVRKLSFEEKPDYNNIINRFKRELELMQKKI